MSTDCKKMLSAAHSPEWAILFSQVRDRYHRHKLKRLAAFCSSRGVSPKDLGDGGVDLEPYGQNPSRLASGSIDCAVQFEAQPRFYDLS